MTREKEMVDPELLEFGMRFSLARKKARVSQATLAQAAGLTQPQLSRLEQGKRGLETVTFLRLLRIAASRGISVDSCLVRARDTLHDNVVVAMPASFIRKLEQVLDSNLLLPPAEVSDASSKPKRAKKRRNK